MQSNSKRYIQILLIILAAGCIYMLPYIRTNFQETFITVFDMDVSEFSQLYVMLGLMYIVGYFPSGWLADKFSPRILILTSLILTGLAGLYMVTIPPKELLPFVWLIWGISTVFTFWSALLKSINLLATKEEQARVFGILDGTRGLIEAVMATIGLTVFGLIAGTSNAIEDTTRGLQGVMLTWSLIVLFIAVLMFIFLKPETDEEEIENEKNNVSLSDIITVVKKPEVWLVSAIIFCGYTFFWTTYYLGGYVQANFGVGAVGAAAITTGMMWMRPIGGIGGGFLGDKIGKEKTLAIAMFLGSIGLIAFTFFPADSLVSVILGFVLFIGLMSYVLRGLYWSLLDECNFDPKIIGIGIGIISFFGYLPDILIPKLTAPLFAMYNDGPRAYVIYFIVSGIICLIGIAFALIFKKLVDKNNS